MGLPFAIQADKYYEGLSRNQEFKILTPKNKMMKQSIILKCNKKIKKVKIKDILYVEANGEYSRFYLKEKEPELACMTLKRVEKLVVEHCFYRISRSQFVNMDYCEEILTAGENKVVLSNKIKLNISKTKIREFKDVFYAYC